MLPLAAAHFQAAPLELVPFFPSEFNFANPDGNILHSCPLDPTVLLYSVRGVTGQTGGGGGTQAEQVNDRIETMAHCMNPQMSHQSVFVFVSEFFFKRRTRTRRCLRGSCLLLLFKRCGLKIENPAFFFSLCCARDPNRFEIHRTIAATL